MISFPGCSWLPLPPCLPSLSQFMIRAALGCLCRLLQASLSPFTISLLGCRCCLVPQACPFMISLLGWCWLPLPPCLPSLSLFMISQGLFLVAAATLSPKLVSFHDFPSVQLLVAAALSPKLVSLRDFPSGLLLGAAAAFFLQACRSWLPLPPCLPSLSPFMIPLLGCFSCQAVI